MKGVMKASVSKSRRYIEAVLLHLSNRKRILVEDEEIEKVLDQNEKEIL